MWKSQWFAYNKLYYNPGVNYTHWPDLPNAAVPPAATRSHPIHAGHTLQLDNEYLNYDSVSIEEACQKLHNEDLEETIIVDCSHGNSRKKHQGQERVLKDIISQRLEGNQALVGMMLESNLCEGNQPCSENIEELAYGVSVTDECISWETTEKLLRCAHGRMKKLTVAA